MADPYKGLENDTLSTEIKHRGYFNYDNVPKAVSGFLKGRLYDYKETKIVYKPDERALEIESDKKVNEHVKFEIKVSISARDLKDVDLIKDGKKSTTQEGFIFVKITSKMNVEWMKRHEKAPFLQKIQAIFYRHVLKSSIGEWDGMITHDVLDLTRLLRTTMELEV